MQIDALPPDDLDELEPLWSAMRERHGDVGPEWLGPVRDREESWRRRRADYAKWLAEDDTFVLVARDAGRSVGYAVVTIGEGAASTWRAGGRHAELGALAVLPEARAIGVGAALLAEVRVRARALGAHRIDLTVVEGNEDA